MIGKMILSLSDEAVSQLLADFGVYKSSRILMLNPIGYVLRRLCDRGATASRIDTFASGPAAKALRESTLVGSVLESDFLKTVAVKRYDFVIIGPSPVFGSDADIATVALAMETLKDTGILRAVMSPEFRNRQTAAHRSFDDDLNYFGWSQDIPEGGLMRGTNAVPGVVVHMDTAW